VGVPLARKVMAPDDAATARMRSVRVIILNISV
jgi:hypothetical protein